MSPSYGGGCPRIVDSRGRRCGGDRPRIVFGVMWGSEVIVDSRGRGCGGGCPRIVFRRGGGVG